MKALIFNSGTGSRMGKLTEDKPKCLLPLPGGETILSRQLRLLAASGIRQAVITTGAYTEQIRQQAEGSGLDIILVENPLYRETNYIYSMHLAQEAIQGSDLLMLHGDLVFDTHVLEKLLKTPGNRCCMDETAPLPPKDFKGRLRDGFLQEVSVDIFDDDCYALQPMYKLDAATAGAWSQEVGAWVSRGQIKVYAEHALNRITDSLHIRPWSYTGMLLAEVDTPADYRAIWETLEECRK